MPGTIGKSIAAAGFANVLFNASSPKFQYGYLLTWQESFAGEDERADVNVGAFQSFVFVEPQVSVADDGPGQPEWQIFLGFNMQFLN